jgi:hypothetical protein
VDEFNNRMDAQRSVLNVINRQKSLREELCGLSKNAIERWISVNLLDSSSEVCTVIFEISDKLFFLANKSQEQITEEYKLLSIEILKLKNKLEEKMG